MVLNGPTKKSCALLILKNFNKNKKSLKAFIYKQSLCKLKGFSDFLKSGAYDGHSSHNMYDHQPHSNTTKVVLGSASDNVNY